MVFPLSVPAALPGAAVCPSEISIAFVATLQNFAYQVSENSRAKGFWDGPENDNLPTKVALMHSELSELLEAHREGDPPCEKPVDVPAADGGRRRVTKMEEEAADVLIRLLDFCVRYDLDLPRAALAKAHYNAGRPHMHGGKRV